MRILASLVALACAGCVSKEYGRPPGHVDLSTPPEDARTREPARQQSPEPGEQGITVIEGARVGSHTVLHEGTTAAVGASVEGWYTWGSAGPQSFLPSRGGVGLRSAATYAVDHGVSDVHVGVMAGTPILWSAGGGWVFDPTSSRHGVRASLEFLLLFLDGSVFPSSGESRIEIGLRIPFGVQNFVWYR